MSYSDDNPKTGFNYASFVARKKEEKARRLQERKKELESDSLYDNQLKEIDQSISKYKILKERNVPDITLDQFITEFSLTARIDREERVKRLEKQSVAQLSAKLQQLSSIENDFSGNAAAAVEEYQRALYRKNLSEYEYQDIIDEVTELRNKFNSLKEQRKKNLVAFNKMQEEYKLQQELETRKDHYLNVIASYEQSLTERKQAIDDYVEKLMLDQSELFQLMVQFTKLENSLVDKKTTVYDTRSKYRKARSLAIIHNVNMFKQTPDYKHLVDITDRIKFLKYDVPIFLIVDKPDIPNSYRCNFFDVTFLDPDEFQRALDDINNCQFLIRKKKIVFLTRDNYTKLNLNYRHYVIHLDDQDSFVGDNQVRIKPPIIGLGIKVLATLQTIGFEFDLSDTF